MQRTLPEIYTIGVYGSTEEGFFRALKDARIDTFVDIRRRRGLRGAVYSYANSQKLQSRLSNLGIRYVYMKDLAPSQETRRKQAESDKEIGVAKRAREELSDQFIRAYSDQVLSKTTSANVLASIPDDCRALVLFCVERAPSACHRSLVANLLAASWDSRVTHLKP
jgi:uncharacterized protein (DUF488 family)